MVCTIFSLAISAGWSVQQIDVQNTFLHDTLFEDVFHDPTPWFSLPTIP